MRNAQNVSQILMKVCHQIHKQGQQPSVALLRAKAPIKISLSQAIEAVRLYSSQDPDSLETEYAADSDPIQATEPESGAPHESAERIHQLESELAQLKARMTKLEALVANIREQ